MKIGSSRSSFSVNLVPKTNLCYLRGCLSNNIHTQGGGEKRRESLFAKHIVLDDIIRKIFVVVLGLPKCMDSSIKHPPSNIYIPHLCSTYDLISEVGAFLPRYSS